MNSPPFLNVDVEAQATRVGSGRTCLLVLGMHRSGTSALTRVLSIAGAKLPATLMGPNKGNELGHWESEALVQYHDHLLEHLGSHWHDWRALEFGRLPLKRRQEIKVEIADLLAAEFGGATLFVLKDPRICRFTPIFLDALEDAGVSSRIVHIVRNPLEVAESLERRDGLLRTDAALQWLRHVLDSEVATRSHPRVITSYDGLLTDWRATFDDVTEALRVAWPYSADDIAGQVTQFLDPARHHHTHTTEDVLLDPTLRNWIGEAYSALLVLEQSPGSKAAIKTLDAIRREFNHAAPILHQLHAGACSAWDKHLVGLKAEISQTNAESERLSSILVERKQELSDLRAALADRDKQITSLSATAEKTSAKAEQLNSALSERDNQFADLSKTFDETNAKAQHLAGVLTQRDQEVSRLSAALDYAEDKSEQLNSELSEKDKQLTELDAAVEKNNAEAQHLAGVLAQRDQQVSRLRVELDNAKNEVERLNLKLCERDKRVTELDVVVDKKNAEAEKLVSVLETQRDQQVSRLRVELDNAKNEVERLNLKLCERDKQVTELDVVVDKKNAEAEHLAGVLAELEEEGAALKVALNDTEKKAADAKSLAAQRYEQLERATYEQSVLFEQACRSRQEIIDHFRSSTSWKLTRPLRAFKQNLPHSTFLPKRKKQLFKAKPVPNDDASIIRESGLFNDLYYLSLLRDDKIKEPIEHYLQYGQQQGLNPNPLFDSDFYTTLYAPHIGEGINPFVHYIQYGSSQGFDPSRLFQTTYYCDSNPDVQDSGIMPLLHYLIRGRVEGRMPINVDPSECNPLTLQMHRLDLTNPDSHQFNPDLYAALHPELIDASGRDIQTLLTHYETAGRTEGRIASLAAFLKALGMPPEAVPINFDNSEYYELNADLNGVLPDTFFHAIEHYLQFGIREKRKYSYSQCYIEASVPHATDTVSTPNLQYMQAAHKVACLVHVYYPDVWPKIYQYVRNLESVNCDVFVNVTDAMWSEEFHSQIRRDLPDASIVISENRGRDIGGHLNCLAGIRIDEYAAFFLVHTKKSKHFSEKYSEHWRNGLLDPILGTEEKVAENLALMNSDPDIGIIGAAAWRHREVDKNSKQYSYLLRKFGIGPEHASCDYVSGTMMIVKPKILKRIYEVLRKEEFENADGKSAEWLRDGQLEHAAERLFANVCRSLGYKISWR